MQKPVRGVIHTRSDFVLRDAADLKSSPGTTRLTTKFSELRSPPSTVLRPSSLCSGERLLRIALEENLTLVGEAGHRRSGGCLEDKNTVPR